MLIPASDASRAASLSGANMSAYLHGSSVGSRRTCHDTHSCQPSLSPLVLTCVSIHLANTFGSGMALTTLGSNFCRSATNARSRLSSRHALMASPRGKRAYREKNSSKWSFSVHLLRSHIAKAFSLPSGMSEIRKRRQCILTDFGGLPSKKQERRVKMSCPNCPLLSMSTSDTGYLD